MRGMLVRVTDGWTEVLRRRETGSPSGPYPVPVQHLLGEMVAAACLMQANIKFNGALILQIFGDGPVKLAVAEVQPDLALRATATVNAEVLPGTSLSAMSMSPTRVNVRSRWTPKTGFRASSLTRGWCPCLVTAVRSWSN